MYFTYGWPTVLQLKPRRVKKHSGFTIEDMIYDDDEASIKSTTTNKNENAERNAKASVKEQPERVVQMLPSPIDGRYIAILTTKRLSIWSGHQSRMMLFHEELKEFLGVKGDYPVGMCWAPKTPRSAGLTLVFVTAYGHIYSFCVEKLPKGATPMYRDCPPIAAEDTARFTPLMATYDTQLKLFEEHMQHQEKEQEHKATEKNDSEQQQQEEEKEEEGTQEKEKKKVADKDTFLPPPECTVVSVAADEASLKGFFVVTKTGTLILVSWKLEVIKRVELRSVVLGNGEADPQLTVKSILLNTKKRALIVVSDKGLSVVLNVDMAERPTEADAIVEDAKFVSFRANIACKDVTAVAFNNVFDLITVGRSNGFVENHFLEDGAQETKASKVYSTDQWGIPDGYIGEVSCLEWSHDGRAIATGWSKGGMCIWSFYGCRLFCSVTALSYQQHQQKKKQQQQGRGSEEGEEEEEKTSQQALGFLQGGIASLCWTSSSYSILIAEEGKENQVVNIDFVKSAVDSTSSMHWNHAIVMMGPSTLWVLSHKSRTSLDFSWSYASVPDAYINENWPVQMVSVDKLGKYIAVSGRRGLLVYNTLSNTWKSFEDKREEQAIECVGLCWYESSVVAAVYDLDTKKYTLRIYPRTGLGKAHLLGSTPLSARPRFMDCVEPYVVLIFDDGSLHQCQLVPRYEDNALVSIEVDTLCKYVMTSFTRPVSLAIIPSDPTTRKKKLAEAATASPPADSPPPPPSSSSSSSSSSSQSPQPPVTKGIQVGKKKVTHKTLIAASVAVDLKVLTLDARGRLYIKSSIGDKTVELTDEVEHFWLCAPKLHHLNDQQWNMVWAYGGKGLQLWHNVSGEIEDGAKPVTLLDACGMNDEVYPVGVMPQFGTVVGVSLVSSPFSLPPPAHKEGDPCIVQAIPFVTPRTESHPFLQCILRESIKAGDVATAKAVVSHFYTAPILAFSLERLLFESFEEACTIAPDTSQETETAAAAAPGLFQKIVGFLQENAPSFPALVVSCARKIDPSLWTRLFSFAGDVLDLFAACIEKGDLHSAGTYLPVILEVKGEEAAARSTAQILPLVLAAGRYALAADILRFSCKDPEADLSSAPLKELYSEEIADILNSHARVVFASGDAESLHEFQKIIPGKSVALISTSSQFTSNENMKQ